MGAKRGPSERTLLARRVILDFVYFDEWTPQRDIWLSVERDGVLGSYCFGAVIRALQWWHEKGNLERAGGGRGRAVLWRRRTVA